MVRHCRAIVTAARRPCVIVAAARRPPPKRTEWQGMASAGARLKWQRPDLHVVLCHPQIPFNTGAVARTCAATATALHLIGPLGFELDNAKLKRAGLDYWDQVAVRVHPSWADFATFFNDIAGAKRLVAFSKLGRQHHAQEGLYQPGASNWLLFGAETTGLPPEAHAAAAAAGAVVKIPMANYRHVRSLNLSTSVGIGVFEALRQLDGAVLPEDAEGEADAAAESAEAAGLEAAGADAHVSR